MDGIGKYLSGLLIIGVETRKTYRAVFSEPKVVIPEGFFQEDFDPVLHELRQLQPGFQVRCIFKQFLYHVYDASLSGRS